MTSPPKVSQTPPSPLSETEARFYYHGLPSRPKLVARTTTNTWEEPTGPEAYLKIKVIHPVGPHALDDLWEDNVAFKIHRCLDAMNVKWTSTDVVRMGTGDSNLEPAPVILWIGVLPKSLTPHEGLAVASQCQKILDENNLADVGVEIRESVVTRSAGPKLLKPLSGGFFSDLAADIWEPLATTLGLPICAHNTPGIEGTGGFFVGEGDKPGRLLLVTARHVVFPPGRGIDGRFEYKYKSQPRHSVTLFGEKSFEDYLESIKVEIDMADEMIQELDERIPGLKDDPKSDVELQRTYNALDEARKAAEALKEFRSDVSTHWGTLNNRTIGHVILSPPIALGVGRDSFTEDWAVIEIDPSKIDQSNFIGNAIDLGTRIPSSVYRRWMHPNPKNRPCFTYPKDHLLRLRGVIPKDDLIRLTAVDQRNKPCLMVMKRGRATGLTIGRANTLFSYTRDYSGYITGDSKEWPIFPRDPVSGPFTPCTPFSAAGDSGSVIVDGQGRIGGLLTGGTGATAATDVTYATPAYFILERMEKEGLWRPHANPDLST